MKDNGIEQIRLGAEWFREALEKCPKFLLGLTFADFPHGACGDASLLLGKYIQQSASLSLHYVCGELRETGNFQTHAWLEHEDFIIDITADQFEEIDIPVLITTERRWHDRFEIARRDIPDYDICDGVGYLSVAYYRLIDWAQTEMNKRINY